MKSIDEVMTSVYERDYVTVRTTADEDGTCSSTQAELDAYIAGLQAQMKAAAANLEFEKAADAPRPHQAVEEPRPGPGREPALAWRSQIQEWSKDAVLEVQEYVRLVGQVGRARRHAADLLPRHHRAVRRRSASAR